MDLLKGFVAGLIVYVLSSILSARTGIDHWLFVFWLALLIVVVNVLRNDKSRDEKKSVLLAIGGVAVIGTLAAFFIGYVGANIDKWL